MAFDVPAWQRQDGAIYLFLYTLIAIPAGRDVDPVNSDSCGF